jgi:hypothetical protein
MCWTAQTISQINSISVENRESVQFDPSDSQLDEALKSMDRNALQGQEESFIASKNGANRSDTNGNDLVKKLKNVATIMSTINRLAPPSLAAFEPPAVPGSVRSVAAVSKRDGFNFKQPLLSTPMPQPPAPLQLRDPGVEMPSLIPKELRSNSGGQSSGSHSMSDAKIIEALLPHDEKKK